jgi:hypothetical protein
MFSRKSCEVFAFVAEEEMEIDEGAHIRDGASETKPGLIWGLGVTKDIFRHCNWECSTRKRRG